jgi:hypothetical protein
LAACAESLEGEGLAVFAVLLATAAAAAGAGTGAAAGMTTVLVTWMTQTFFSSVWPGAQFAKLAAAGAAALATNAVGAVVWAEVVTDP